jgi:hypothetical protein
MQLGRDLLEDNRLFLDESFLEDPLGTAHVDPVNERRGVGWNFW